MKRLLCALLALTLALSLAACRQEPPVPPDQPLPPDPPPETEGTYTLTEKTGGKETKGEDGQVLSRYSYSLYFMEPSADAGERTLEKVGVFNAKMEELRGLLEQDGESLAENARELAEAGYWETVLTNETTVAVSVMGDILSCKVDGYSYSGGAHPNTWSSCYIFDWAQGAYINPIEVADNPEQFRATVTDQLLDQIMGLDPEVREGYFTGYEETAAAWNDYCVVFRESGLEITFSAYELGPYAMGSQVFTLSYEDLGDVLGETGRARLGLEAA